MWTVAAIISLTITGLPPPRARILLAVPLGACLAVLAADARGDDGHGQPIVTAERTRTPITIDNHGRWIDVRPQSKCPCDPSTGRIAGEAPSRAEMVKGWQKETSALVGLEKLDVRNVVKFRNVRA